MPATHDTVRTRVGTNRRACERHACTHPDVYPRHTHTHTHTGGEAGNGDLASSHLGQRHSHQLPPLCLST